MDLLQIQKDDEREDLEDIIGEIETETNRKLRRLKRNNVSELMQTDF